MNREIKKISIRELVTNCALEGDCKFLIQTWCPTNRRLGVRNLESFVDYILKGFMPTPLIFSNEGNHYECIDGNNQLYTLLTYYKGEKFKNLSEELKNKFLNSEITVAIFNFENFSEKSDFYTDFIKPYKI